MNLKNSLTLIPGYVKAIVLMSLIVFAFACEEGLELSSGSGNKTAYVKLRDSSGSELVKNDSTFITGPDTITVTHVPEYGSVAYFVDVPGAVEVRYKLSIFDFGSWIEYGTGRFGMGSSVGYDFEFKDVFGGW
ncbi:MAG: hypothetical protein GY754_44865 [bacterium]|nr:hypothetical protein [bacterium]